MVFNHTNKAYIRGVSLFYEKIINCISRSWVACGTNDKKEEKFDLEMLNEMINNENVKANISDSDWNNSGPGAYFLKEVFKWISEKSGLDVTLANAHEYGIFETMSISGDILGGRYVWIELKTSGTVDGEKVTSDKFTGQFSHGFLALHEKSKN